MNIKKIPPPPPPRPNVQSAAPISSPAPTPVTTEEKIEPKIKEKKTMSREFKMGLLISVATASLFFAIICVVLIFVL